GFDGRRQQVIAIVGADNRREGDLAPFRRAQDGRAGEAIRIGGRHEGRCSYVTATMLARFERFPTTDVEMETLLSGVVALHVVPAPLPEGGSSSQRLSPVWSDFERTSLPERTPICSAGCSKSEKV